MRERQESIDEFTVEKYLKKGPVKYIMSCVKCYGQEKYDQK